MAITGRITESVNVFSGSFQFIYWVLQINIFFFPGVSVQTNWIFNTGPYGHPPLKIKILKIWVLHVKKDHKIGLEPNFHEPGS